MRSALPAAAILAALSWTSAHAFAQVLHDPTEPPADGRTSAAGVSPAVRGTTLQSVIVSEGRKLALIDGVTYKAGDKLGDDTVAAISEGEVTLRGPEGVKVLRLYENLKKRSAGGESRFERKGGP